MPPVILTTSPGADFVFGNPHGSGSADAAAVNAPQRPRTSSPGPERKRSATQRSPAKDYMAGRTMIMNLHDQSMEGTIAAIKRQIDADAQFARSEIDQLKDALEDREREVQLMQGMLNGHNTNSVLLLRKEGLH